MTTSRLRSFWYHRGADVLYWAIVAVIIGLALLALAACKSKCIAPRDQGPPAAARHSNLPDQPVHARAAPAPAPAARHSLPDGEFDVYREGDEECPGGHCRVRPQPKPPPEPVVFSPPAPVLAPVFDDRAECGPEIARPPAPDEGWPGVGAWGRGFEAGLRAARRTAIPAPESPAPSPEKPAPAKPESPWIYCVVTALVAVLLIFLFKPRRPHASPA